MSKNTKIEWATHTFNPWEGCQKCGPGCDLCYAEARNKRFGGGVAVNWGPGAPRRRTSEANWRIPRAWNAAHDAFFAIHGHRQRVFCASLADVFDNAVPVEWRMDLFELIADTPNLDWLLLTKRIGNVMPMCSGDSLMLDVICQRVWLGATVVNQEEADRDIPKLLAVPAHKRFLSMEPLLGPVDLGAWIEPWNECGSCGVSFDFEQGRADLCPACGQIGCMCTSFGSELRDEFDAADGRLQVDELPRIDWVIAGGESGPGARPSHPDWYRSLRDQCAAAGVPFLFKQWGEHVPHDDELRKLDVHHSRLVWSDGAAYDDQDGQRANVELMVRVGKKAAGRLLDGVTHDGFPS